MRILLLLVILAVSVPAQTRKPRKPAAPAAAPLNPDSWPLASIAIEGNRNYTPQQILAVAGLRAGQISDKAELDGAHGRLMASGGFDSVAYRFEPTKDGKGVALTYTVVEVNAFYPLMLEDLPASDSDIKAWLQQRDPLFGPRVSATKEALQHFTTLVSEYLETKGFHEPLTARLSSENPPDLVILIRPATQRPSVAQVTAMNTGDIQAGVIQSTLYGVAVGSTYSEPRMRQLLDASIRPLYEAKGHLRVAFPKITGAPATDVKGVAVTVTVEQGPVFNIGKVKFSGVPNDADEMENVAKIKTGELANFDDVKAGQRRLVDYFRHNGYMQAKTEALRTVNDAAKTVDLNVRIDTGPQFTFRQLNIVGLDIISEPEIRKMWGLKEGKPYNPDYPDHFLERVKEDGIFDGLGDTAAERKIDPDGNTVDVTLTFKGAKLDPEKRRRERQIP